RDSDDSRSELVISIWDNGPGIEASDLNNIFDPFYTTKEPGKGTGLGLSVSHAIVEAVGGRISARSEEGEGAEITVTLPVTEERL
ncbi:MAG: ATP-binding protein, partial [Lascolabacillus sp.]|nr:ATP-binding protein [Lascolabacillus sp.]